MGTAFDDAFTRVVGIEGRYSNNPHDSGGETMWGITAATARSFGYAGPMASMPQSVAKIIYRARYWDKLNLERVSDRMPRLAQELFDSGVNCGTDNAGTWLQRALNGLNLRQAHYPDVVVDGDVGPQTLSALAGLYAMRGGNAEIALCRLCDDQQGVYYLGLTERRPKDEDFLFGWILNRVGGY